MENVWNDDIAGERKDLAPIMEEEDKRQAKGFFSTLFLIPRDVSIQNWRTTAIVCD